MVSVVGALAGGLVWLALFHQVDGVVGHRGRVGAAEQFLPEEIVAEWMNYALVLLVWHGGLHAVFQSHRAAKAGEQAMRLRAAATQTRIQTLGKRSFGHTFCSTRSMPRWR